jgi:NAD(P)-dependent dehydrogenase (short-subunit alcohol dehydrogenase family)
MPVALITGTSTGIGLATALHFGRQGHDVWAGVRQPAAATDLRAAIDAERLPVRIVTLDVEDRGSANTASPRSSTSPGASTSSSTTPASAVGGPIEDVPVDWVKTLFETNYFGVLRVTKAVLPGMRERRAGAIVNVSSVAGRLAVAGHGHYSAVKHALEAMSEVLAQEVQRFGIRVSIVEPGVVVTPIFSKAKRWADPASPYFDHVRRLLLLYQKQMPHAAQPADAAQVIYEAATTSSPRLRWLVGEDAKLLVAGRQRQTDEEYVAGGRAMSEEEFLNEARRRYGFTW